QTRSHTFHNVNPPFQGSRLYSRIVLRESHAPALIVSGFSDTSRWMNLLRRRTGGTSTMCFFLSADMPCDWLSSSSCTSLRVSSVSPCHSQAATSRQYGLLRVWRSHQCCFGAMKSGPHSPCPRSSLIF